MSVATTKVEVLLACRRIYEHLQARGLPWAQLELTDDVVEAFATGMLGGVVWRIADAELNPVYRIDWEARTYTRVR